MTEKMLAEGIKEKFLRKLHDKCENLEMKQYLRFRNRSLGFKDMDLDCQNPKRYC